MMNDECGMINAVFEKLPLAATVHSAIRIPHSAFE